MNGDGGGDYDGSASALVLWSELDAGYNSTERGVVGAPTVLSVCGGQLVGAFFGSACCPPGRPNPPVPRTKAGGWEAGASQQLPFGPLSKDLLGGCHRG